jgi:heat-inducible transcriptional repressor
MRQLTRLNQRSRDVFCQIVDTYIATGTAVGSRTLSEQLQSAISPATIRGVMADLEKTGLIYSPYTSAGRIPTHMGLRLFVDGFLEVGNLSAEEKTQLQIDAVAKGARPEEILTQATSMLSGLSQCASIVFSPKDDKPLKHIEFVHLSPAKALVILVHNDNDIENRIIEVPAGLTPSQLTAAGNYLNSRIAGKTFRDVKVQLESELKLCRAELDVLSAAVVKQGLAFWSGAADNKKSPRNISHLDQLIVRGRANLLENVNAMEELEKIRVLFDDLETKKDLINVMELAKNADGVKIFIGSENNLFSLSGSSVIASPYMNEKNNILGVIGVIGPTRLNYARIIPMVDYTAKILQKLLEK